MDETMSNRNNSAHLFIYLYFIHFIYKPVAVEGRRGVFALCTKFRHISLFSARRWHSTALIPVHDVTLVIQLIFGRPWFLFPSTQPCKMVLDRVPHCLDICPSHCNFRRRAVSNRGSYAPIMSFTCCFTESFVL